MSNRNIRQWWRMLSAESIYLSNNQQQVQKGTQVMLKKMLMITIVLTIILSASVAGILPDDHQTVSTGNDTLQAKIQIDFNHTVLHSDPECPTPTSGNGGGC